MESHQYAPLKLRVGYHQIEKVQGRLAAAPGTGNILIITRPWSLYRRRGLGNHLCLINAMVYKVTIREKHKHSQVLRAAISRQRTLQLGQVSCPEIRHYMNPDSKEIKTHSIVACIIDGGAAQSAPCVDKGGRRRRSKLMSVR